MRIRVTDKSTVLFPVTTSQLRFISDLDEKSYKGDRGMSVVRLDTNEIIKNVSSDYNFILHADVIKAIESAFEKNSLEFEIYDIFTGGVKRNKMFINYALPHYKLSINGDEYLPFLQVQNSYDKSSKFKVIVGLYRTVDHTMLYTFKTKFPVISSKHYGNTVDLSKLNIDVQAWLSSMHILKDKLAELESQDAMSLYVSQEDLKDLAEKIFSRKKDVTAYLESNLYSDLVKELGANRYSLLLSFMKYATHNLSSRMKDFNHVAKSFIALEKVFFS